MGHTYTEELEQLKLGEGETMYAECALVILKAMLEEGVAILGGWPGAPVSNLTDVFEQSYESILKDLGIFSAKNVDEKSAAAMMAESTRAPVRSAVAFKSVGLNHASDTVAHIASSGVIGGAVVFVGEDYGCSSTVIAERVLPYAHKSSMPLLEPKASIPHVYRLVKHAFSLSEHCGSPVYFVIQTHVGNMKGKVRVGSNRPPSISMHERLVASTFDEERMLMPPWSQRQEEAKVRERLPRAKGYVRQHRLNHLRQGEPGVKRGFITHGYIENMLLRVLELRGDADPFGKSRFPVFTLHCLFPLIEEEVVSFLQGLDEVLIAEEGIPALLEEGIRAIAQKHRLPVEIRGKDLFDSNLLMPEVVRDGVERFLKSVPRAACRVTRDTGHGTWDMGHGTWDMGHGTRDTSAVEELVGSRDPQHCTGCPIRPVHAGIAIQERREAKDERRKLRFAFAQEASCCILSTYAPFNQKGTMTGLGTGLASVLPHTKLSNEKVIAFMGDGTYWHSGLTSSIINAIENEQDCILYIILNFHTAMTGGQANPSTPKSEIRNPKSYNGEVLDIERSLRGHGAKWVRVINPYDLKQSQKVLEEALNSRYRGPKFIISKGQCMLMKQRKLRAWRREALAKGKRVAESRYLVDPFVCTGDHSCIGINGCPSLTVLPAHPNPLRKDRPVAIDQSCVGCGLCEENAQVAKLCPSFAKVTKVSNPSLFERLLYRVRYSVLGVAKDESA